MTEGPGLGIQADVGANIVLAVGSVKEQLQRLRTENLESRKQQALDRLSNYLPFTATVTLNGSGVGVADLGTPMLGRIWTLRQLMAAANGGELAVSAPANIAWYIGPNVPGAAAGTSLQFTNNWRASFANIPAILTYTSDILQVHYGDHLFVVVNGPVGLAGVNLVLTALVKDEPAKAGIPTLVQ